MSEERRLAVLRAIVQDYVDTSEPVGSKGTARPPSPRCLCRDDPQRHGCPEEEGLIAPPHERQSDPHRCRVPTFSSTRLAAIKPMSVAERRAISHFLDTAVDLDDVVERTVRLLSTLTRQVALVQYPVDGSSVRHESSRRCPRSSPRRASSPRPVGSSSASSPARSTSLPWRRGPARRACAPTSDRSPPVPPRRSGRRPGRPLHPPVRQRCDADPHHRHGPCRCPGRRARGARGRRWHLAPGQAFGAEFTTSLGAWSRGPGGAHDPPQARHGQRAGCARRPYRPREPHAGLHATSMVSTGYGSGSDLVVGLGSSA